MKLLILLLKSMIFFGCNNQIKPVISYATEYAYPFFKSSSTDKQSIVRDTFYIRQDIMGREFIRHRWVDTGHNGKWQEMEENPRDQYSFGKGERFIGFGKGIVYYYDILSKKNDSFCMNDRGMPLITWRKV